MKLQARFVLGTLLALVAMLVVACGGAPEQPAAPSGDESSGGGGEEEASSVETLRQAFGGGPVGGAFQTFATGLALIMADSIDNLDIAAEGTGGSGANLRGVNANDVQFGISYAGDIYLGANGQLPEDETNYTDVRPVAALYGGAAHLVVSQASGIETVADVAGKRIAPGNAGSGAALSAERYFTQMGLYDQLQIEYLGYSQAAAALGDGQLDGFWVLAAYPNSAVTEASTLTEIRIIDLQTPGSEAGLFEALPFYSPRTMPAGPYEGVDYDVLSFQDTAIWTAHKDVSDEQVYEALKGVFSEDGLKRMVEAHPAAGEMSIENGVNGIPVPLHPGAYKFWSEQGIEIPEVAVPK